MTSRLALNILRAFILVVFALLAGFVVFCLAASAQAAPAAKAVKPLVKMGRPYRAELTSPKLRREVQGLSLTFPCKADCNLPGVDANALYLYWRDSVQFRELRKSPVSKK